jgi:DNA-binding XRE family transcriptional regulator
MPDKYKDEDPVKAYRNYCINEKTYAKWEKGRKKPEWWT